MANLTKDTGLHKANTQDAGDLPEIPKALQEMADKGERKTHLEDAPRGRALGE